MICGGCRYDQLFEAWKVERGAGPIMRWGPFCKVNCLLYHRTNFIFFKVQSMFNLKKKKSLDLGEIHNELFPKMGIKLGGYSSKLQRRI